MSNTSASISQCHCHSVSANKMSMKKEFYIMRIFSTAQKLSLQMRPRLFLRNSLHDEQFLVPFSKCFLEYFAPGLSNVFVKFAHDLDKNQVILTRADEHDPQGILLVHPDTCPIRCLTASECKVLEHDETLYPRIAASAILESSDGHILLTRRAKTLRSFPGVWVGPGGYTDPGETTDTTVLRETHEEIGLDVVNMDHEISILNIWESAFPPIRDESETEPVQLPKRHDIVVYYHVKLALPANELLNFSISVNEVDMVCWLSRSNAERFAFSILENDQEQKTMIDILEWSFKENKLIRAKIPLSDIIIHKNVSAGTKWAIGKLLTKI